MTHKFKVGDKVVITRNICREHGRGKCNYYHYGNLITENVPLQTKGTIAKIFDNDKIFLRLNNGQIFYFHPYEVQKIGRDSEDSEKFRNAIKNSFGHPLFELAEQTSVYIVNGKVYVTGEGKSTDSNYIKKSRKRKPLIEAGEIRSLDELAMSRAANSLEKISKDYANETLKGLNSLTTGEESLDIPQLIYRKVFPYLRAEQYKSKVAELIGAKSDNTVKKNKRKAKINKSLEEIVEKSLAEVEKKIAQIEIETEYKQRSKKELIFDYLLGNEQNKTSDNLEEIIGKRDLAIINGFVYGLERTEKDKPEVKINGNGFRISENKYKTSKLEKSLIFGLSKKIRIDSLKNNIKKEKIIELLKNQNTDIMKMRRKAKYEEDGFGFVKHKGDYYVYANTPRFAIKSPIDGNYYLFDEMKVGLIVTENNEELGIDEYSGDYESGLFMIKNKRHPFTNEDRNFESLCIGHNDLPTTAEDDGELIAKTLLAARNIVIFSYKKDDSLIHPHRFLGNCETCEDGEYDDSKTINHYKNHIRTKKEIEKMRVPICDGDEQ